MQGIFKDSLCQITDCLIEWCYTPFSTVFQSYHSDISHFPVFPWFQQYETKAMKTPRQCGSKLGPQDYDWHTLPMKHAGAQPISDQMAEKVKVDC